MITFDQWMQFYCHGFRPLAEKMDLVMQALVIRLLHAPHSHIATIEMKDMVIEDHPYLEQHLTHFEFVNLNQIWLDIVPDFIDEVENPEAVREMVNYISDAKGGLEDEFFTDDKRCVLMGEYIDGKPADGSSMKTLKDLDDATYKAVIDAFMFTSEQRGISMVANGSMDYYATAIGDGGEKTTLERRLGTAAIDAQVEEFAKKMDASNWFGGGDTS